MIASIPSPSQPGIGVGPFEIHAYGLMYAIAVTASILIVRRRWRALGGDPDLVYDVAIWAFPAGLLGGRLYFDITSFNEMPHTWYGPIAVWDGGLGIWGGIAAGAAVGIWRVHRAGVSVPAFMDATAPALLVAQAIGRVGNYFNQELFGGPTSLPWGLQISPAHRPEGYLHYATFQPTFLYEIIWNLALAAFLVWLGHHRKIRPPGLFALYVDRLLRLPHLRGEPPRRPRPPHPRPAPQLLGRDRPHPDRLRLVRSGPSASRAGVKPTGRTLRRGRASPTSEPGGDRVTPTRSSPAASRRCRGRSG